jgi:PKD repeat protein
MKLTTVLVATLLALPFVSQAGDADPHPTTGLSYIPNRGQWPNPVLYRAEANGLAFFAEHDRITWSKLEEGAGKRVHDYQHMDEAERRSFHLAGHAWYMHFVDARPEATLVPEDRRSYLLNYFLGNDPASWASNVPAFGGFTYEGLWSGIDMRWYGQEGQYKYDLLLAPGADAALIAFAYEGLDGATLNGRGDLVLNTSVGDVTELRPVAHYGDGLKEPVTCAFVLRNGQVGFTLGDNADRSRPIVIDPLLIASTLSGTGNIGLTENYGHTATYDAAGNIYTGAICFGQGYPATPGAFDLTFGGGVTDIAISKLNPDGSNLIWATYIGGSGSDYPHSLVTNASDEIAVYGSSDSFDYPTTAGAFDPTANGSADIVVTKLNATGSALVGSTYVGGTSDDGRNSLTWNYGDNYRGEIITDAGGNIYVSSCTNSSTFPTTAGAYQTAPAGFQDGVVFCMNPDVSSMVWGTCMGTASDDVCFGLKLDGAGGVYACGATNSAAFPTTPGAYQSGLLGGEDGFVVHVTAGGTTLAQSTYFGGATGEDDAFFIELDTDGFVYIYGQTAGGIAIQPPGTYGVANGDIFVAKFDALLSTTIFTSTIGAPGGFGSNISPIAFLVDVCDHIYISGHGQLSGVSAGMPLTPTALQNSGGFYLAAFDVDMTGLLFGTYYGDISDHVDGGTSRFDANGIVYQGVCTGGGFPTTPWAWSNVQPFGWDIAVFKIDFQVAGVNAAAGTSVNTGCAPLLVDFLNSSTGSVWSWDFGDGSPLVYAYDTSHVYTTPGVFTVTLIAMDSLACNLADTTQFTVTVGAGAVLTASFTTVLNTDCTLSQVITTNTSTGAPLAFEWDMGDGTQYTDTNVVHNYAGPGTYDIQLLVYDPTGCGQPDSVTQTVTILPPVSVTAAFTVNQQPDCSLLIVTTDNLSTGPSPTYQWDMGDGTQYFTANVTHTYATPGLYTIQLIANDAGTCNLADTITMQIQVDPVQPVSAAFTIDQVFDCAQMIASTVNNSTGTNMIFNWDMGDGTLSSDTNVVHTYLTPGTYTVTLIVSDGLGCSPSDTATFQVTIDPLEPVVADFTLEQTGNCTNLTVDGINLSTGDSVSYSWDMGDGTVLTTTDVNYVYTAPGTYTVTLTVTDLGCGQDDSFSLPVTMIVELPTPLVSDAVFCTGDSVVLDATSNVTSYLWSTGATTPTITVDQPGTYSVEVFTADCYGTDTVEVIEAPEYELSFEVQACPDDPVALEIPLDGQSYSWSTGGTQQVEHVIGAGDYIFTVIDDLGCPHTDTATVIALDGEAQLYAPNAFTPDGDGVNDNFLIAGIGEDAVELLIFDRWGEELYSTNSLTKPWMDVIPVSS